jgi:hypothetical protein
LLKNCFITPTTNSQSRVIFGVHTSTHSFGKLDHFFIVKILRQYFEKLLRIRNEPSLLKRVGKYSLFLAIFISVAFSENFSMAVINSTLY